VEITAVSCDLRGFTRYAQAHPSQRVIEVLSDYYAEVGRVVADFGGTIKDYAGDGILILVGAPIANPDHARIGLSMAEEIRRVGYEITQRWSDRKAQLGIGLGVASGFVTVGVIGSASRLEYTAVGSAVNLASRLCEEADDQQILVAPRTEELAGDNSLTRERAPRMKGFAKLDHIYALPLAQQAGSWRYSGGTR
jgi:class 3 adenylate cyclase